MKVLVLAAVFALSFVALPGLALAQSAGDEQYTDPLAPPAPEAPGSDTPAPTQDEPAPAPSDAAPSSDSTTAAADPSAQPGEDLPRTGIPVAPFAIAGLAMLAAGLMLRRSLIEPDPASWPYPVRTPGLLASGPSRRRRG